MEKGNCGLFSTNGIVIYHVMSELCSEEIACVWDMTKYNNATSKYKLISIVEADGKNDVSKGNESSNSDLYKAGDVINNLKWNDGNLCVASITINSINEDGANISIKDKLIIKDNIDITNIQIINPKTSKIPNAIAPVPSEIL